MDQLQLLESKVKELSSLLDAFKELNTNIELNEVFQNILMQMVKVLKAEAGTLWVADYEREIITASAVTGPTKDAILNIKLDLQEGIVGKVISTGEPYLLENVSDEPSWAKRVDESSGFITKSMITVPLIANQKVLGALQLLNKKGDLFFNEEDVNLALALANQSALALQNSQVYNELYTMFMSMITTLAKVLDARDPYTAGHSERVARYAALTAARLGFNSRECKDLYRAALMHDIGKMGVSDDILRKPTRLTQEEYTLMKQHTVIGADILSNLEPKSTMKNAVEIARSHHERLDGSGYPDGLKGDDIPMYARIVGVVDAFDAMTTIRSYSNGKSFREAAEELIRCKHTLFDVNVVDAFTSLLEEANFKVENLGNML
ncbi:HD domain-containing protein [Bacillus sp. BGMRC 2118]|nr:HD domain-containing protein [Bacillus sp. BGMRC 2118]